ncbi:MAG TPA: hypothetical protein VFA07_05755 [Chthonomonadaceae bacterium]|nr:hypothetical protein [Chthonomonadaceae bacterium]
MADASKRNVRALFIDKEEIQKIVAEQNAQIGFVPDPTATPEKVQAMTRALGIRPEDNLLSRGIIAERYGHDPEDTLPDDLQAEFDAPEHTSDEDLCPF